MRKALFLDRDGVINTESNYVHKIEDFEFINGIFDLCRAAIKENMLIVIVTNQAGIGRGLYTEAQFHKLMHWVNKRFIEEMTPISAVYFCPDHPIHGHGIYRKDSLDRKPNPGMFLRAHKDLLINLTNSTLIGDKETDIQAAKAAGVGRTVLLTNNQGYSAADLRVSSLIEAQKILFPNRI